jgi:IS30 family transposase
MTLIMTPTKRARAKELAELGFVHRDIACHLSVSEATISRNLKTMSTMADAYQRAPVPGCPHKLNDRDIRRAI